MRLSEQEIHTIRDLSISMLGNNSIWLFGSRIDNTKKGGDIDLLVVCDSEHEKLAIMRQKSSFLAQLKDQIGDQKIDLIYATASSLTTDPFLSTIHEKIPLTGMHLVPLTPSLLPDFFAFHKDFGGCFCAVWTTFDENWQKNCSFDGGIKNFESIKKRTLEKKHIGYFLFENGSPIAWTGAGPKSEFPLLRTKLASRLTPATPETWVLGCFAVGGAHRGKGVSDAIVSKILAAAKDAGAKRLEAYPVSPPDEQRAYRGSVSLFKRHGFLSIADEEDEGHKIHLMSLELF